MRRLARTGTVEATVAAPPDAVWQVLVDVTRIPEWSHEAGAGEWLDGAREARLGARFRATNRTGHLRWTRVSEVTSFEPGVEFAWRTIPTWLYPEVTQWRVRLEPAGSGTRIVQSFEVVRMSRPRELFTYAIVPAHRDRTAALTADLVRLGDAAELAVRTAR